jgi:hypothetical protein
MAGCVAQKCLRDIDFIGRKDVVNNLRTRVNMLSSKLPAILRKTVMPTRVVRGVLPFLAKAKAAEFIGLFATG